MKKRILHTFLLLCIAVTVSADPIGPTQALRIAAPYLKMEATVSQIKPLRRSATRSTLEADTLAPLYIIDRGESSGFVIVSGDNSLPEVLGYTESGDYVEEEMAPAFFEIMDGYVKAVETARVTGAPARTATKVAADRKAIQPLIQAHWKQGAPYNNRAPFITGTEKRAVTGCACTAAGMVLHYFQDDLTDVLLASTTTYEKGDAPVTEVYPAGTPLKWDLMLNSYSGSYPSEMADAVALFNAALGAALELKYGSSTSGTINSCVNVFNKFFNVSCKCEYQSKTSLTQAQWEQRIYDNLINRQPMIYRGTSDSGGGHAFILDGYDPNGNLFHFNLGWGGSSDGYYTLSAEDGVGGYSNTQGLLYDIEPKKPNMQGKLHVAKQAAKRAETPIRVEITNNAVLDQSEFLLFWGTTNRVPTSSTSVSKKYTDLKVVSGESGEFTVSFKPSSTKTHYIFLTDKYYNLLDQAEVEVVASNAEISLEAFSLEMSGDTEEFNGDTYHMLYNSKTTATAMISNAEGGTAAQPTLRLNLFRYNEETDSLEKVRSISCSGDALFPGESKPFTTTVSRISNGERYAITVGSQLSNMDENNVLHYATTDTIIRFKVCAPTLEGHYADNGTMIFTGGWDDKTFRELAVDPAVARYDLTQVTGVNSQPIAANPNALFYTAAPCEGYNIVYEGHISDLRIQQGYPFSPVANHTASVATFTPQWHIGLWHTLSLPFTALVSEDYACRRPTKFISTAIREAVSTDTLIACRPYLLMTCSDTPKPIIATDVTLNFVADTTDADMFEAILVDTVADARTLVLDIDPENTTQYFNRVDSGAAISAFTGVIRADSKRVRASVNNTLEQAYAVLAQAINSATHIYEEWHTQIEPAWNVLLLDSIASMKQIFSGMTLTTINSVKNAAADLLIFAEQYKTGLIDKSEPIDYSSYITNASFEKGKKDGWSAPTLSSVRTNSTLNTLAAGIDGSYFMYCESSSKTTVSQVVENLPRGYYRLTAMVGTSNAVTLFANDSSVTVTPHEWGKFYLTDSTVDSVWVENGSLNIGVENSGGWYKIDNFRLYYLGADNATGICMPKVTPNIISREGIYDLFGRRVADRNAMIPGQIYVIDGRKTIAK